MKTPLKVGEMVAVYGSSQTGRFTVGDRDAGRSIGTVTGIRYSESWRNVRLDDGFDYTFHVKQLRRLKPKVKAVPREWVLSGHLGVHAGDYAHQSTTGPELAAGEKVIVREVLK